MHVYNCDGQFIYNTKKHEMIQTLITPPKPSAKQQRFKKCMLYARAAMQNKTLIEQYSKGLCDHELPFKIAFSDAYHAPKIENINLVGYKGNKNDVIRIRAKDDFKVVRVKVNIFNQYNQLIEKGCARNSGRNYRWAYKARTTIVNRQGIFIMVTAFDLAGNRKSVKKEIHL